ncbi:subclass B3 metallo-beta-lactamase [Pedosphaera parvula]|nr:subclass B3 metallo-beta-lactamase [Pedosphaera parvula]
MLMLAAGLPLTSLAQTNAPVDPGNAAVKKMWESWNAPFKPFRIINNVYYVGATGVSSFLITTPEGHILIDTGFESTVPRIRASVAQLGFRPEDIKIILSSHAHLDHTGGHALMKQLTGAKVMISKADADLLASGGTKDYTPYAPKMMAYSPVKADRILVDEEKVSLGKTTLTCHLTPGHTKGCTTWTMDTTEAGKVYHVLFFGSTSVLSDVKLVNNPKYPNIAEDYLHSYQKLKTLQCDVFLAPHGSFFGLSEKAEKLAQGGKTNPFIDSESYRNFIQKAENTFLEQLAQERAKASRALGN